MPFFLKPMLKYTTHSPAVTQLPASILSRIRRLFITHTHWDHISGVEDFANICVAMAEEEMDELSKVWPSQRMSPKWCHFKWKVGDYRGFDRKYDVFEDGSVVIVPLFGHTKGSIGFFLKTTEKSYFLVGDLAWSSRALRAGEQRSGFVRWLVDENSKKNKEILNFVRMIAGSDPQLVLLPNHDSEVQDGLGYFPKWITR